MDLYIFQKIDGLAGKFIWLDLSAVFFAGYFGYILVFFLLLFLLRDFKKNWKMTTAALTAAVIARLGIVEFIRWTLPVPRPFVQNSVNLLINHPATPSFPSGHAAFFFGLAAAIYFYNKKIGTLFLVAAFLISMARIFAGVHWPLDILAGALIGMISGWLTFVLSAGKFFPDVWKQEQ